MEVKQLALNEENPQVIAVLNQLRPDYSPLELQQQITKQQQHGYHIIYVQQGSQTLGVAGFVINEKLAWGKNIYVDDLITDSHSRSCGVGTKLIDWLKDYARAQNCKEIHLDSGVQRFLAHKFYLRESFVISSHHFTYRLS
ncbi:N-acetyltransferase GCN5 [Thalassotalea loyana]|uniref:N-acetyltransferase GCN5 n=1 Tax=Thalassotalea loyana TaxID=280483 RepID=A0ABQ6HIV0_9GAMM|nr:GNAT family N-acetyltransferase [Thalassotalea loyana]GLX86601.1 N-acetyltransferase GCN5 [Thalassotalea loyana]